jgi:hypothetical protein
VEALVAESIPMLSRFKGFPCPCHSVHSTVRSGQPQPDSPTPGGRRSPQPPWLPESAAARCVSRSRAPQQRKGGLVIGDHLQRRLCIHHASIPEHFDLRCAFNETRKGVGPASLWWSQASMPMRVTLFPPGRMRGSLFAFGSSFFFEAKRRTRERQRPMELFLIGRRQPAGPN